MASPGQSTLFNTFTELVSTTHRAHQKIVYDNMSYHNALFNRLKKKGNIKPIDGGLSIVRALDYAQNSTFQRYSGFDVLNVGASDVISAAEYAWKQAAVNVVASGLELRSNSGSSKIVDLAEARLKNAQRTLANSMSSDAYSDGTASNQINGLQALIADAGTGTVGGINSSTYTFWRNQVRDASDNSVTVSASTIEAGMMSPLWLACIRGGDKPDLIVMDSVYFQYYEASQASLKRYASNTVDGGFVSLKYHEADVVYDSSDSGVPASHMYFVNTDFLELVVHKDANFEIMPELRSVDQDAVVIPILFQGNLVCSNRARQGVGKA